MTVPRHDSLRTLRILGLATLLAATPAAWAVEIGEVAPPLAALQADGQAASLDKFRGQVIYLDFWASWCAPCRAAMPHYDRIHRARAGRGLVVIGINVDSDRGRAKDAIQRASASFPIVFDEAGTTAARYAVPAMPTAYLIGRDGRVRNIHHGFRDGDVAKLETLIDQALEAAP